VLSGRGALLTGTADYLVHALPRDAQCTSKLGLAGTRLVRGKQGAAEGAPGSVKTLKGVACFRMSTQDSLDLGVPFHARTI
jgi:hypothetical protein